MANYFSVDAAFWTDADVIDNFTPEDKYFYLYLLTSIHGNISGCYEISLKQVANEMGYSIDTVQHLIERFVTVHKVIDYSKENKEILIHNWGKHHWTASDKYLAALKKKIESIKTEKFRRYLEAVLENFESSGGKNTVWIRYPYGMDTTFLSFPFHSLSFDDSFQYGESELENGDEGEVSEEKKEPEQPKEEAVITLILNDKTEYPVYPSYVSKMSELYPSVNVMSELRKMSAWCINNPKKRKTKNGITAFINKWLAQEQDRGRGGKSITFMDL